MTDLMELARAADPVPGPHALSDDDRRDAARVLTAALLAPCGHHGDAPSAQTARP